MAWIGFLYGFGVLQGVILSFILLRNLNRSGLPNLLIAGLLLCISVHLASLGLAQTGFFDAWPALATLASPLRFLWGPLLYLYAYRLTHRTLKWSQIGHGVFFLIMCVPALSSFSLSFDEQRQSLNYLLRTDSSTVGSPWGDSPHTVWSWMHEYRLYGTAFAFHFAVYCLLVLHKIRESNRRLEQQYSSLDEKNLNWLRVLTISCLLFVVAFFVFNRSQQYLLGYINFSAPLANIPFLFLVIVIYMIGVRAIYQPSIVLGMEQLKERVESLNQEDVVGPKAAGDSDVVGSADLNTAQEAANDVQVPLGERRDPGQGQVDVKPKRAMLDDALGKEYEARLVTVMREKKLYLDCELTMPDLAEAAGLAPYQTSEVLNHRMNKSFFNFVNHYRIALAKQMMGDSDYSHMAIVELAVEVGFKSKSSFYDAFKREVQMTPTQYKKSLVKERA